MAEKLTTEKIEREAGYLYYLGKDGYAWRAPMRNNPDGTKAKVGSEYVEKEDGYMYFIDKEGYVARSKLNREGRKPKAE